MTYGFDTNEHRVANVYERGTARGGPREEHKDTTGCVSFRLARAHAERECPVYHDALLNSLPQREFNQTELAEHAGVSRQSVGRHLDILVDAGIIEPVDETSRQRYRFAPESPVSEALVRLDERSQRQSLSARASCSSPRRHAVLATNTEDETRSGSEGVAGSSMRCSERIRE